MYSLAAYGKMIADAVRMEAYTKALQRAVTPSSIVLDIGAGLGLMAMLARRLGARRVYAIEPDPVIQIARELAAANFPASNAPPISFIQDISTRVTLPEKADVIVSDLRGALPLFHHHIPSIIDARRRLLAPGGLLIPQRDTLWIAAVESPELWASVLDPWGENAYGFDWSPARRIAGNSWIKARLKSDQLLSEPKCWATLDYRTIEDPNLRADVNLTATRDGTLHGLCLWFDATLLEGISFSNSPLSPEAIYGSGFFPVPKPVSLAGGDVVAVALRADLVGEDYIWQWDTRVLEKGRPDQVKAAFKQSTFLGQPLSPAQLRKRASDFMPALNDDGKIDQFILQQMNGQTSLAQVAQKLAEAFPQRFARPQDALARVSDISQRYTN